MDEQTCLLTFESFSYNTAEVKMRWVNRSDPILLLNPIQLPDFTLTDLNTSREEVVSLSQKLTLFL